MDGLTLSSGLTDPRSGSLVIDVPEDYGRHSPLDRGGGRSRHASTGLHWLRDPRAFTDSDSTRDRSGENFGGVGPDKGRVRSGGADERDTGGTVGSWG